MDGPRGIGKKFLYHALLENVRLKGMIKLASATSGVAETILPTGRTTHLRFDISLQADEATMTNMSKKVGGAKIIRQAKFTIWDEAPMSKRHTIEIVDISFYDIMDSDIPFRGKVMSFGGDFCQFFFVVPKSTRVEMVNASLVRSYLWPLMENIQLSTNIQARMNTSFNKCLLRFRNGE